MSSNSDHYDINLIRCANTWLCDADRVILWTGDLAVNASVQGVSTHVMQVDLVRLRHMDSGVCYPPEYWYDLCVPPAITAGTPTMYERD